MDNKKINEDLQNFWNNCFANVSAMTIKQSDIDTTDGMDKYFKYLGDNCERILDIGTGFGLSLITAKVLGEKCNYALGIDTSENAINFVKETCKNSNITGIDYVVGDDEYLETLEDKAFNGIICSNVLDVIPEEISFRIINSIDRLLDKDGYLLLKFNFYLTEEIIAKIGLEHIGNNYYVKDGILRVVNHTTEEWISKFKNFKVVKIDSYERIKGGPEDRVLLLQKI